MLFKKEKQISKTIINCPYCQGKEIVKKGQRKKRYETVQLYFCKKCSRKFTPSITKHKTYPLRLIIDSLTLYNRLNTLEESAKKVSQKYGIKISPQNISNWLKSFGQYLPISRMREFISKKYKPNDAVVESTMFHGQIYDFKYHRAKLECILQDDFKHYKFKPLKDFLELVFAECPHQIFQQSTNRASEYKKVFNLDQTRFTPKTNMATQTANFIIQAIASNKLRHEILQEFMLANDSVTIACEVPVLLDHDDLMHYKNELNFQVPIELDQDQVITGHIDLIQVRNGIIHLMDYKPSAHKEKPIDQLTLYALAMSRLTSLRLFHFKCAWFDKENYYEFFPLHVVYKKKKRQKKK